MKKCSRVILIVTVALTMALSSFVVSAGEISDNNSNKVGASIIAIYEDGDGSKAYQLVWKYKESNGHLYRRRWNATLGQWYDPDWILVY